MLTKSRRRKEKLREHRPDVLDWSVSRGGLDLVRRAEQEKREGSRFMGTTGRIGQLRQQE